jgi:hypothetical protein
MFHYKLVADFAIRKMAVVMCNRPWSTGHVE